MLLAILAGVMAGGSWVWLTLLAVAVAGLGHWAARRDWLVRAEGDAPPRRRLRDAAVVAVSAVFCRRVRRPHRRQGLAAVLRPLPAPGAGRHLLRHPRRPRHGPGHGRPASGRAGLDDPRHVPVTSDWEGAISFPLVAVCVSLLSKRNGERIRALSSQAHDLDTLLAMSQMMDTAVDLEMTLNLIMLNVQNLSGCQVCAVYLKDAGRGEPGTALRQRPPRPRAAAAGAAHPGRARRRLECGGRRTGRPRPVRLLCRRRPLPAGEAARPACWAWTRSARSFACLPLTSVESLIGMLYVGFDLPNGLRPAEVNCLEQFAARAGLALQRGLLQQDFQALAYTDAMTGLDNYRQFEHTLHDELRRAERYGRPLSMLLLDIDHFKTFNDTLGHPAGDALLGQLGTVLRNALRGVDRPARYGGEEFAVVCPETGAEEARLIAERVRRAIAETPFFLTGQAGETAHVTVSVGFATFPARRRLPPPTWSSGPTPPFTPPSVRAATPCAARRTSRR